MNTGPFKAPTFSTFCCVNHLLPHSTVQSQRLPIFKLTIYSHCTAPLQNHSRYEEHGHLGYDLQGKKSYFSAPFALNESPAGTMGAEVIGSESDDFAIGDIVTGFLPWQRYIKVDGKAVSKKDTSKIPLEKILSSVSYSGLSVSAFFACAWSCRYPGKDITKHRHN